MGVIFIPSQRPGGAGAWSANIKRGRVIKTRSFSIGRHGREAEKKARELYAEWEASTRAQDKQARRLGIRAGGAPCQLLGIPGLTITAAFMGGEDRRYLTPFIGIGVDRIGLRTTRAFKQRGFLVTYRLCLDILHQHGVITDAERSRLQTKTFDKEDIVATLYTNLQSRQIEIDRRTVEDWFKDLD